MGTDLPRIGCYELRQRLPSSTSEVWQAYDIDRKRLAILKIYQTDAPDAANLLKRYMHNVEQVASLRHPNITRIYDVDCLAAQGLDNLSPQVYIAVEYVEGGTLADYIKSVSAIGKMPLPADVLHVFSSIALALGNALQADIVHGNLKPSNILLNRGIISPNKIGIPKLTDFGWTRLLSKEHSHTIPHYLAPEQIKGLPADERSDIYALGVMLYELYTGTPPFRGNRPIAIMMQHINALPTAPDLVNPSISPTLAKVILRSLAKAPQERFPHAVSMAVALANALRLPIPDNLKRSAALIGETAVLPAILQSAPSAWSTISPSTPSLKLPVVQVSSKLASDPPADQINPNPTGGIPAIQVNSKPTNNIPPHPLPPPKGKNALLIIMTAITLLTLLGTGIGTWLRFTQKDAPAPGQAVGQAFFVNSGQLDENTLDGMNDELQIDLTNIPDPARGKSYYVWLLGDIAQTEANPILLGRLTVEHGKAHFLFTGNQQHTNLLAYLSRFLINEDDTLHPSSDPSLDESTWRYYAALPQAPDSSDPLHFSLLNHLRYLLAESPELAIQGLHGGLAFWFARDTAMVANITNSLSQSWQMQDATTIHNQLIRILDYLDGPSLTATDLPPGTPFLADSQMAQVPLLGPTPPNTRPSNSPDQALPPVGYIYLLQMHLNAAMLSSQATPTQHQLASQISQGLDGLKRLLMQIHQDAKQLIALTNAQLLQGSTLTVLNDMATQTQYVYTGQPNPSTGISQSGSLWAYNNIQRLATLDVMPYTTVKP